MQQTDSVYCKQKKSYKLLKKKMVWQPCWIVSMVINGAVNYGIEHFLVYLTQGLSHDKKQKQKTIMIVVKMLLLCVALKNQLSIYMVFFYILKFNVLHNFLLDKVSAGLR